MQKDRVTSPSSSSTPRLRMPAWLKRKLGGGKQYAALHGMLDKDRLHTICHSGQCPNQGECWQEGAAAFMILGEVCTRRCKFCATPWGHPQSVDVEEGKKLAQVVQKLPLKHIVLTSVDRDDLPDGGASHWVTVIETIREQNPDVTIETLLPDFMDKPHALEQVLACAPEIVAHNMETVKRLTPIVRSKAQYDYSLGVLQRMAQAGCTVKSGLMLGLGETRDEVETCLQDMIHVGCHVVTLGQYLQPSRKHYPVLRYISPFEFDELASYAYSLGYRYVEAGPLVRSSFHAERALEACGITRKVSRI